MRRMLYFWMAVAQITSGPRLPARVQGEAPARVRATFRRSAVREEERSRLRVVFVMLLVI